jgi:hypothetical protein
VIGARSFDGSNGIDLKTFGLMTIGELDVMRSV